MESTIAPPGGDSSRSSEYPPKYAVNIIANEEVRDLFDPCGMTLSFRPLSPGAPEFPFSIGHCADLTSAFNGPGRLDYFRLKIPAGIPDGAVYELELRFVPGTGPRDSNGQPIPIKLINGTLLVSSTAVIRGDVNQDGILDVGDAVESLRLAVGLEATGFPRANGTELSNLAYTRAAGDADRDGQLTVDDAVQILRWVVSL